jgi:hypothetical protein
MFSEIKIAIFSDTHDQIINLKKALNFCQKENIKEIIHCGDLTRIKTLIEAWPNQLTAKIHFVYGNADIKEDFISKGKIFPPLKIHGQIGTLIRENKKIAFTHYPEKAEELSQLQEYDYVFYGHTHKPWEKQINRTKMANPGNLANISYQPSFAVLDLEKNNLSLKILNRF